MENEELVRNTTGEMPEKSVVAAGEVIENVQICPFGDSPTTNHTPSTLPPFHPSTTPPFNLLRSSRFR